MERLDKIIVCETDKGNYAVRPLNWAGYWDKDGKIKECGLNHIAVFHYKEDAEWYAETKNAEEQGLILRPKCRLGDVVYALWSIPTESKYVVYPAEVKEINLSSTNARKMIMYKLEPIAFRGRYNKYYDDDFGNLVFMSQEEAEQALAERKNDE